MFDVSDFFVHSVILSSGNFSDFGSFNASGDKLNIICYVLDDISFNIALSNSNISVIICLDSIVIKDYCGKSLILSNDPARDYYLLKSKLINMGYFLPDIQSYISSSAKIHPTAIIAPHCYIGENVVIGRNAIINDYTKIMNNCIIADNCMIGHKGLSFKRGVDSSLYELPHSGGVIIHENVELLSSASVQRSHDADCMTSIGHDTKISVNVNIAHSCQIGNHTLISGNVQIAGWAKIGDYCWIGTSSTISDSVIIGNHAQIRIGSVVVKNVKDGQDVSGNFAYDHVKQIRNFVKAQK